MASGSITTGTAIALGQTTIVSIQLGQGVSLTSFPAGGSPPQISASSLPTLAQPISRKIPLGVLIGGVFGGSLFLLLLILLTWYFRHRKAAQRHVRLADECPDGMSKTQTLSVALVVCYADNILLVLAKNRTLTAITPFRLDIHSASTRNLLSPNVGSRSSNSSFLGGGISASSGRRRSIEKPAFSPPETPRYLSSPSVPGTMITTTSSTSSPRDEFSFIDREALQHSLGSRPQISRQSMREDSIPAFGPDPLYMPSEDANDIARPPSYHLLQAFGN